MFFLSYQPPFSPFTGDFPATHQRASTRLPEGLALSSSRTCLAQCAGDALLEAAQLGADEQWDLMDEQ